MEFRFKREKNLDERKQTGRNLKEKFPDKIPIILEKDPKTKLKEIDKSKFLVSKELTVANFLLMICKRMEIDPNSAIVLMVKETAKTTRTLTADSCLRDIYEKYADKEDGFLYIIYTSQLFWG